MSRQAEVNPEKTVLVGLSWGSWQGSVAAAVDGGIVRAKLPEGAYQAFLSLYEAKKGKYNDLCGSSSVWAVEI